MHYPFEYGSSKNLVDKYFGYQSAVIKVVKAVSGHISELQGRFEGLQKTYDERVLEVEQLKSHKNVLAEMVTSLQKTEMKQFNNVDEFKLRV